MRRFPLPLLSCLLVLALFPAAQAREPSRTKVPPWDVRGVGPLPWQGVACLDVNPDGSLLALGTIAPAGDPNVLVLDSAGKVVHQYQVGQRGISQVVFGPDGQEVFAVSTMPEGRAGDRPEVFRLTGDQVLAEKVPSDHGDLFHYGDHSNHATFLLARQVGVAAVLRGSQILWPAPASGQPGSARIPLGKDDLSVALAVDSLGEAVVGTTVGAGSGKTNLYVVQAGQKQPLWSRPVQTEVDTAPRPEKGLYGTPTLPDGRREELPQRDEKVWGPLALAVHVEGPKSATPKRLVAAADYQGWQDANQGVRFLPSRPTVTVYDPEGKVLRRFGLESFAKAFWCELAFLPDGQRLLAWPHHWTSRGLAGQPVLPADEGADTVYILDIHSGQVLSLKFPDAIGDLVTEQGDVAVSCWDGKVYLLSPNHLLAPGGPPLGFDVGGPGLVRFGPDNKRLIVAGAGGVVRALDRTGKQLWQTNLNEAVPRTPKPWVANARATPIVPGVWQLPGGRVESDLGGQRLVEAPDGLILIEAHAGLSFEREWEAIKAVGLDPMRVKYVLATHEHGDHAPGAYLWRVVTGAQFVCSEEMAYTLQHHVPLNTGYGLHPPVPADVKVTKDEDLDLAGLKVRAVRIPGHTYGSMAWRFEKGGKTLVAFGDLIMPRGVLGYSGSVNFSARDALASLRKLQDLQPDLVLPGHGAVEGPENYLAAGIDVGRAAGWGFIRPERPDPYFRITQKNVVVAAWNLGATSAAFGDVDGDGRPDVVVVAPAGDGSVVKVFLNKDGKFDEEPDHTIPIPQVSQPHKIRLLPGKGGARLFVAGKSAALLEPEGKVPGSRIVPLELGDGNGVRVVGQGEQQQTVFARRFGGCEVLQPGQGAARLTRFQPEVTGPYADLQALDLNGDGREDLVTSYGQVYLRGEDGKLPPKPSIQLPVEKNDWSYLAVGDFNADGKPDVALLSYGMNGATVARVFYNQGTRERPFHETPDATIPLGETTGAARKGSVPPLLRDAPVVADWNGDGVADLIVGFGQSDEVLVLFGGKEGLDARQAQKIKLDYRVHYETRLYVGDFNGDGLPDLAVFGYTNTGVGAGGPPAAYIWLQPPRK
jgi:glyoxylase-like metal-dependent hydrolase (beta-lactamase superfamily II)